MIYIAQINYNQFFQFVCIMIFFDFDQIITLMLSACKVLSNIFITSDQILEFIMIFDKQRRVNLDDYFNKNKIEVSSYKYFTILFY